MRIKTTLKLLAPYIAVGIFWCGLSNAWLTIFAYHAQIILWSWSSFRRLGKPRPSRIMLVALPMAAAGPVLYLLLPYITHTDLQVWMVEHHLSRLSLAIMIPYFGLLHPFLEQVHWAPLRERTSLSHPLFAGYHLLVLYSLLTAPWLALCFVILVMASFLWQKMATQTGGLTVSVGSHILADLGVILAAWWKT